MANYLGPLDAADGAEKESGIDRSKATAALERLRECHGEVLA